jgi:aspartyl-tRNA(Asn)/glutamyl-tRNA(Gln) amidotransferase subunit B
MHNETYDRLIEVIQLLSQSKINGKQAKTLFEQVFNTNKTAAELVDELGFIQITDQNIIQKCLHQYIEDNPNMVSQYKERPERVEKFFLGLLMRDTKGQANPNVAIEILRKMITKN